MNIAVMTDSNSGITQEKAKELGIFVVPMPFTINKESFLEDITLTQEEFYHKLEDENTQIMTSQPAIGDLTKYWRSALESHDAIIYIPMSSGLSGSCQTAMMLSDDEEFEGKVFVLDTHRISVTQEQNVLDAIKLVKEGKSVEAQPAISSTENCGKAAPYDLPVIVSLSFFSDFSCLVELVMIRGDSANC